MSRGLFRSRLTLVAVSIAVILPAAAIAGSIAVSGQQALQITVGLSSKRAGAMGVTIHFRSRAYNPKHPAQQIPYDNNLLIFKEPKGMSTNPSAVPKCLESAVLKNQGKPIVCPADTKVGTGSVTINARPTIRELVTGTVNAYNGSDDHGYAGYRPGSPELILYVTTSSGLHVAQFLHVVKTRSGAVELVGNSTKPSKPGVTPGHFTLQKLDLTVSGSGAKQPYIANPPACPGSWTFALTITNYFGAPSTTATDRVACSS